MQGRDAFVRAVDFGLPAGATACVTNQVARLCESGLTIPTSVVVRDCLDVSDQEGVPLVDAHSKLGDQLCHSLREGGLKGSHRWVEPCKLQCLV